MSLEKVVASIQKEHGVESISLMGDKPLQDMEVIPTGNIALDVALGVGGYPRGRIVEIYGPESSGKTTLTLHAIAEAQKKGFNCAFIDAEHALDPQYASAIGINIDELLISQPDSGEQALGICHDLVLSHEVPLIVVDSVAALTPRAEIAGDMGDSHVGLQARLMSQALRKLAAITHKADVTIIFINQLREKIGIMFGNPETTPGGRALKFYSSVRLDVRRIGAAKDGEEIIGNETRVKVVKNKVAPPFQKCEFVIVYGEGISQAWSLLDFGVDFGVLQKKGAWYYDWNGEQIGQGKAKSRLTLEADPDMMSELYSKVMDAMYGGEEDADD